MRRRQHLAGDTGFAGVALYPQLTTSDSFAIGLRGEFFSETDGFGALVSDGDADNFSLTLNREFYLRVTSFSSLNSELTLLHLKSLLFRRQKVPIVLASFLVAAIYSF